MGFVGIEIDGLEQLKAKLKKLPEAVQDEGADNAYDYLVRAMRQYPPRKSVTRKSVYGVTFFTDKQRRWFFAALKSGGLRIPYPRTQRLSRAWRKVGQGRRAFVGNDTPYAHFMYDDNRQSRMAAAIGWDTISEVLKKRNTEIVRRYDAGVKNAIKKLGL